MIGHYLLRHHHRRLHNNARMESSTLFYSSCPVGIRAVGKPGRFSRPVLPKLVKFLVYFHTNSTIECSAQ